MRRGSFGPELGRALAATAATAGAVALVAWCAAAYGPRGPAFAFLVTWLAMCWWGIVGRLYPVTLPQSWFRIRGFERDGRVYEDVGVRLLKAVLRRGPLSWFNPSLHLPADRTPEGIARLERGMRHAETAHVVLFGLMLAVVVHDLARGWWSAALWMLGFDLLINAWPVALQRYNRAWLERAATPAATSRPAPRWR